MKTIQVTIDESLLKELDQVIHATNTNRSAFMRDALRLALRRHNLRQLERQHAEGYTRFPVQPGEFDAWESEQAWGTV